jgi:hypothetical protein
VGAEEPQTTLVLKCGCAPGAIDHVADRAARP